VLELVRAFDKASGRAVPCHMAARRPGDVGACYADATLARQLFGWQARRGLEAMCADSWRWLRLNPGGYAAVEEPAGQADRGQSAQAGRVKDRNLPTVAVIGLGYVGLPLDVEFGKQVRTIGFDIIEDKVAKCSAGSDPSREIPDAEMALAVHAEYTSDAARLKEADRSSTANMAGQRQATNRHVSSIA
jgi:hypothetical protein